MYGNGGKVGFIAATMLCAVILGSAQSEAHATKHHHNRPTHFARVAVAPVIQCVAFAKQDAGIDISGDARDWWDNAAGVYERGSSPENGSVLSFRANGRMPLGHVAVVSGISDSRTIVIDQSHWNSRGITREIAVKDVSEENDWSAVRVQLGRGLEFGSIYLTHGFIYPRPDRGVTASNVTSAASSGQASTSSGMRRRAHGNEAATEIADAPESYNAGKLQR